MTGAQPSVCRDKTTVCAPIEFGTLPWNEAPNGPACVSFSRTEALNELPSKANGPAHAHLGQLELHAKSATLHRRRLRVFEAPMFPSPPHNRRREPFSLIPRICGSGLTCLPPRSMRSSLSLSLSFSLTARRSAKRGTLRRSLRAGPPRCPGNLRALTPRSTPRA